MVIGHSPSDLSHCCWHCLELRLDQRPHHHRLPLQPLLQTGECCQVALKILHSQEIFQRRYKLSNIWLLHILPGHGVHLVLAHIHLDDALPHQRDGRDISHRHVLQTQATKQPARTPSGPEDTDSSEDCQNEGGSEGRGSSQCLTVSGVSTLCSACYLLL